MTDDEIAALVARYPLPPGIDDGVLNKVRLARALITTEPTLNRWIADGLPVLVEGTSGREWEIQLSAAYAWKCARDEGDRLKNDEADRIAEAMRFTLIGGTNGDSIRALPPKERQQLYEVEAAYVKLKRERNQTLDRDAVMKMLTSLLAMVRDSMLMLPDTLERKCNLDGRGVDTAVEHCDQLLEVLEKTIEAFYSDRPIVDGELQQDLFS